MRKIFLLLTLSGLSYGSGPIFQQKDPVIQQEFENVYKDIRGASAEGVAFSSVTISSLTVSSINGTFIGLGRNRVVNGEFIFDQANGGAAVTSNVASNLNMGDMWYSNGEATDGVFTTQRVTTTPPAGFPYVMRATVTTADSSIGATQDYILFTQLEGYAVRDFGFGATGAKTITLSFYARSSLTGTLSGSLMNNFARAYPYTFVMNAANTWERKSITLAGDTTGTWATTTGVGMVVAFCLGGGSSRSGTAGAWVTANNSCATGATMPIATVNSTLDITGVQVEIGPVATDFEARPYPYELALCQRYYEKTYDIDTAAGTSTATNIYFVTGGQVGTTTMQYSIPFKVTKRVSPTMTLYRGDGTSNSWAFASTGGVVTNRTVSAAAQSTNAFLAEQTAAVEYRASGHWVADARL